MDQKDKARMQRKKSNEKFNSVTQKVKTENQNQTHNARKEATGINSMNQMK